MLLFIYAQPMLLLIITFVDNILAQIYLNLKLYRVVNSY